MSVTRAIPKSSEAEISLLGSLLLDSRRMGDVLVHVKGGDAFWDRAHGAIFDTMIELYDRRAQFDDVQLHRRLQERGLADHTGDLDSLIRLAQSVPHAVNAGHYARLVADAYQRRKLIDACEQSTLDAYESSDGVPEILSRAEQRVFEIAGDQTSQTVSIAQALDDAYRSLESGGSSGLRTGYTQLDEMTFGLKPGQFVIVAARPSMGKTALALNIAEVLALSDGIPVAFFSMEMGRHQLAMRVLSSRSGVDSHRINRHQCEKFEMERLKRVVTDIAGGVLYIDDTPSLTVLDLRSRARRLVDRYGVKAVFVDYLQLMRGPKSENRQQEVSAISRGLKALSKELDMPVICLSQLNRATESRAEHRPRLGDLRESGAIEQDADLVILLHREDYYQQDNPKRTPDHKAEVIVAKHRQGPTGKVTLYWEGRLMRFNECEEIAYRIQGVS